MKAQTNQIHKEWSQAGCEASPANTICMLTLVRNRKDSQIPAPLLSVYKERDCFQIENDQISAGCKARKEAHAHPSRNGMELGSKACTAVPRGC